ncbi:MAG: helix-turn-helix domain-containing protein [Candidatus Riflebacteria bacterium]|nr:helix-turn-helix domain-containing protein [Candidatus Riflebacteria bacterium]
MRRSMRNSLKETVQGLINIGVSTKFTKDELNEIGVINSHVDITPNKIRNIRKSINVTQTVFAQLLNVSVSSIRKWESGTQKPTGSTQVLLELLSKSPQALNFRINR